MKKKIIILSTLILCAVCTAWYSHYRVTGFEPQYIGFLTVENSTVTKQIETILKNKKPDDIRGNKQLNKQLEQKAAVIPQLAFIAVADTAHNVLSAAKKEAIVNQTLFDKIITDISRKNLIPTSTFPQLTRYYFNQKLYFFFYNNPQYTFITAYSHSFPQKFIIRLVLENLLIVIAFVVIGMTLIIAFKEKMSPPVNPSRKEDIEKPVTLNPIEVLSRQYAITSAAFAQKSKKGVWKKMYSYPAAKGAIELKPEIIDELLKGTHVLVAKNRTAYIYHPEINAIAQYDAGRPFKGTIIKEIAAFVSGNSEQIKTLINRKK